MNRSRGVCIIIFIYREAKWLLQHTQNIYIYRKECMWGPGGGGDTCASNRIGMRMIYSFEITAHSLRPHSEHIGAGGWFGGGWGGRGVPVLVNSGGGGQDEIYLHIYRAPSHRIFGRREHIFNSI